MRRLLVFMLAGVAACSGGSDSAPVTPPPTPTIATSLAPNAGTVARGSSATTTVTVARGGGYAGTLTLAADAAPSGVTVTFNPATLTGTANSAVATIAVGNTATPGTSNISINASGSGVAASAASFALTIPTPAITLAAASATASVTQGTAANVGLTITRTNGFADAIALAATGMPTGVTATFAPATIAAGATTSTLVLATANNAAPGTYPITITASGTGVSNVTATVSLTITAAATPAFTLSASPAALNVTAGQNGTSTITAVRTGGFAGDVALAVSGAPAGMTTSLSPASLGANVTTATLAIATTSATAPGAYTLTVNGTGTGVSAQSTAITVTVAAAPGVTLSTIAAQQLSQGTSSATAVPIVLTRTGGLAGDLTMALEGAPTGVTATFTPNPATASSTQMTLTASASAAPGTYTLTVRATGAGGATGTTTFPLTITAAATGSFVINTVPAALSVVQGQTGLSTVNIARAGGFTGAVTLSASGVPAGTNVTFNPAAPTGTQAQLGIDVGAATAAGTYTITIRGQGAGVADATTTLALTVTASGGGGGTGNVNWTFCETAEFPLWFAFQNGTNGTWTRVTPSGTTTRSYAFTVNTVGAVAYAQQIGSNGVQVTVQYLSKDEMTFEAADECRSNPATKTLTGTVAGLSAGQTATVSVGSGVGSANTNGPVSVTNVPNGTTDLFAYRFAVNFTTFAITPDRMILRRNVNFASVITPTLDFAGGDSFAVASAPYTINNANGDSFSSFTSFISANGTAGVLPSATFATTNPLTIYGVPSSVTQAGDLQQVLIVASSGSGTTQATRSIGLLNRDLAARTVTLGPSLSTPTVTSVASAPYRRFTATGTWQSEYADAMGASFTTANNGNGWAISLSRGYAGTGATTYTMTIPDLSAVDGFSTTWGLGSGNVTTSITASAIVSGYNAGTGLFSEGASFRAASRTVTVP